MNSKKKNLNSNLEEAYFLEQDISRKDAKNINDIRKTLITLLMSSSIINKLHFRLHPIQKFYPISSSFLDENKNIWELECAYGKITDESILTGFSSSALITPKLWFDKEPEVVCLYPLLKWNDTDRFLELDNFFKMIQRSYRNPKKFIIINTLEEFEAYLEKR